MKKQLIFGAFALGLFLSPGFSEARTKKTAHQTKSHKTATVAKKKKSRKTASVSKPQPLSASAIKVQSYFKKSPTSR